MSALWQQVVSHGQHITSSSIVVGDNYIRVTLISNGTPLSLSRNGLWVFSLDPGS